MAGSRGLASVLAVALGLVAAALLFHAKHDDKKNMLFQAVRDPIADYRMFPIAVRRGHYYVRPEVQYRGLRFMPKLAGEESSDEPTEGPSAFPTEDPEPNKELEAKDEPEPLADQAVDVSKAVDQHEEPQEPDNFLGDEVIDLPKVSDRNDFGDMYLDGKDVEQNRCDIAFKHGCVENV